MNESCLFESCVTGAFVSDGLAGLSQRVDEEQNGPHVVAVDQVNERVGCHVGGRDGRRIASGLDRSKFLLEIYLPESKESPRNNLIRAHLCKFL